MIKLVVIGKCWDPEGSNELKFGWQALQRQLPTSAAVVHTQATNFEDLWVEATALASKLASTFYTNLDAGPSPSGIGSWLFRVARTNGPTCQLRRFCVGIRLKAHSTRAPHFILHLARP